jgi:PKD domain
MTRLPRIAKLLALPVLVIAGLIAVQAVMAVPTANFTFEVTDPNPAGACATVTFTDASTDDVPGTTFETFAWDLAGTPAAGASVQRTFAGLGPHSVTLTVTDTDPEPDLSDPETKSITLPNTAPSASITSAPSSVDPGQSFNVSGTGSDNGRVDLYQWDLNGNGVFNEAGDASGQTVPVSFTESGDKVINFRTVDNCGALSPTATATVTVRDGGPTGTLDATPDAVLRNQPVTLTATASDPGGAITLYEWDLNGNGVFNEAGEPQGAASSIQTSFATPGLRVVRVRVSDNSTPAKQVVLTDFVRVNFPPEADFSINPSPPLIGDAVTFRAIRAQDPDGTVATYEWDLDGNGSYEHSGATPPAQTFGTAGARSASLRVTDDSGEQSVVSKQFTVGSNIRPDASFRISPARPRIGEEVTFTSTSDDEDDRIVRHEWDFHLDGRYEAQGRVVSRTFTTAGKRSATLRVTDSRGATATRTETFEVEAEPLKGPVDLKRSLGYIRERWGIRLVILVVKVPAKTTVSVTCKGSGCPRGTFTKRSRKKAAQLRFTKLRGSVRAGAKIIVVTKRAGHVPAYDVYTVRGGKRRPLLREGCKPPGAKKARALSACD